MDDLKKIHVLDSDDMLGTVLTIPPSLVREIRAHTGDTNDEHVMVMTEQVRRLIAVWSPEVPTTKNLAKKLAKETMGRGVVVYAGPELGHAAYLWRRAAQRVAKTPAWQVNYPTDAEDDLLSWSVDNGVRPYMIIQLRSNLEEQSTTTLFTKANRILSGRRPHAHVVRATGGSLFEQLLWASVLGQCVAIYAAIAAGLHPADVRALEKLTSQKAKT